jgi:predicted AAA+ superfamily ATPase
MDYLSALDQSPKNLLQVIPRNKKVIVFVDEIQYLSHGIQRIFLFRDDDIFEQCITHNADILQPAVGREFERLFEEYILYGGYPEVVTCDDNNFK